MIGPVVWQTHQGRSRCARDSGSYSYGRRKGGAFRNSSIAYCGGRLAAVPPSQKSQNRRCAASTLAHPVSESPLQNAILAGEWQIGGLRLNKENCVQETIRCAPENNHGFSARHGTYRALRIHPPAAVQGPEIAVSDFPGAIGHSSRCRQAQIRFARQVRDTGGADAELPGTLPRSKPKSRRCSTKAITQTRSSMGISIKCCHRAGHRTCGHLVHTPLQPQRSLHMVQALTLEEQEPMILVK